MILLDTNVLGRMTHSADPQCAAARHAIQTFRAKDEQLIVVPQNFYEFWSVATRRQGRHPTGENGLGMTPVSAALPSSRQAVSNAIGPCVRTIDCQSGGPESVFTLKSLDVGFSYNMPCEPTKDYHDRTHFTSFVYRWPGNWMIQDSHALRALQSSPGRCYLAIAKC